MAVTYDNVVSLQNDIDQLITTNTNNNNQFKIGSDEHLDILLLGKSYMEKTTSKMKILNEKLYAGLNDINNDLLKDSIIPKLTSIADFGTEFILVAKHKNLYGTNSQTLNDYVHEIESIIEVINDIKNYRLAELSELDNILQ